MKTKIKKVYIIMAIVGLILIIQSIMLVIENRGLRVENAKLHFMLYTPSELIPRQQKEMMLPGISLRNIETGEKGGLFDSMKGDELLLFVFSTSCLTCDQASDVLNDIFYEYGDRFTIIGISKDDTLSIKDFAARNHVRFPVYRYDAGSEAQPVTGLFSSLPQTLLANRRGEIVFSLNGVPGELKNKLKGGEINE